MTPSWIPWPTSPGFWWMRLRSGGGRFLTRVRADGDELVAESFGTDHVDRRTAYSSLLEFAPANVEELDVP